MADMKLGRISPVVLPHQDSNILHFGAVAPLRLKSAPPKWQWWRSGIPRIMGMNNQFGTCGPTSYANTIKMFSDYTQPHPIILSDSEILSIYGTLNPGFSPQTGANDDGVILSQLYNLEKSNGAREVNLTDFFAVDPQQSNNIKWTLRIFGPITLGIMLTQADMEAAQNHQPWTLSARQSPIVGGHAVAVYGYDDDSGMWISESWATEQLISYEWMARRTEEVHGFIHPWQFTIQGGPSFAGLTEEQMKYDAGLLS